MLVSPHHEFPPILNLRSPSLCVLPIAPSYTFSPVFLGVQFLCHCWCCHFVPVHVSSYFRLHPIFFITSHPCTSLPNGSHSNGTDVPCPNTKYTLQLSTLSTQLLRASPWLYRAEGGHRGVQRSQTRTRTYL